jgi:hypothetical protein
MLSPAHRYRYGVHGRVIESTFALNELGSHECAPSDQAVALSLEKRSARALPTPLPKQWLVRSPSGTSIAALGALGSAGAQFFIDSYCGTRALIDVDSKCISVARPPSISATRFNHTIMHTLIPYALATQGDVVLHAACVIVGGKTILLCGDGGRGKSTLAAGFQQRGAVLLGEDIVRVEVRNNQLFAFPSYAGARLRSDSFLFEGRRHGRAGSAFGLPKYRKNFALSGTPAPQASPIDLVLFLLPAMQTIAEFSDVSKAIFLKELLASGFVATANSKAFKSEWFMSLMSVVGWIDAAYIGFRKSPFHFQALLEAIAMRAGASIGPPLKV